MKKAINITKFINELGGCFCIFFGIMEHDWILCVAGSFFCFFAAIVCPWMIRTLGVILISCATLHAQTNFVTTGVSICNVTNPPEIQVWQDQGIIVFRYTWMEAHTIAAYQWNGKIYPSQTNYFFPQFESVTNVIPFTTPKTNVATPTKRNILTPPGQLPTHP